eukprot:TRINITY_DN15350_c0_g1_i1.p1 TRINITY_DN15350_c0_g1~~TRINITY_DN15350_c0_g1_i1.p1  ORF type:complete len:126 (+),score=18.79 TRINITY_DN15350_c0_g1_i1:188-565(+)
MSKKQILKSPEGGSYVAIIGDEDTVTGFLLAGIGNVDAKRRSNFLVVNSRTTQAQIEEAFRRYSKSRDIGIILISQFAANEIRFLLDEYDAVVPTILEIPSKEHPYDPKQDSVMIRVKRLCGIRD